MDQIGRADHLQDHTGKEHPQTQRGMDQMSRADHLQDHAHWEGADRPVLLSDLMDMMMLQNVGNRDLEERRLRLKEEKLRMEKESYIARSRDRELDRQLKEAPKFPTLTQETEMELYFADFEAHMRDFKIPKERYLRPLFNDDARRLVRGLEMEQQVYPNIKTTRPMQQKRVPSA